MNAKLNFQMMCPCN